MRWCSWGKKWYTPQMVEWMWHCLEHGRSSFDHADSYGSYTTEADCGKAFAQSGIGRDQIQLVSKCGIQLTRGRDNQINHYQYDRDYIVRAEAASLTNLKTDPLDWLLLHGPRALMHPGDTAAAI